MSDEEKCSAKEGVQVQVTELDAGSEVSSSAATGTVRGLSARHIQLIGIGSTIGTGLWIGTGRSLAIAGPGSVLIAYFLYSLVCWGICQGCGEQAAFRPVHGGFIVWSGDWVDPALGFATGVNFLYTSAMFAASDMSAVAGLFSYWAPDVNPAVWITLCLAVCVSCNCFHVKYYGEAEFWFASLKCLLMLIVIGLAFVTMVGGNPLHDAFGFRYWNNPGSFNTYIAEGNTGRFLAFWAVFKVAAYSLGGPEFIAMTASEAYRPFKTLPKATRSILFRLTFFFITGVIAAGILVPYNSPLLTEAIATGVGAEASPFVVGQKILRIKYLPDVFNFFIITSALSSANGYMYVGSRILHALAHKGQAPAILRKTTKSGVPIYAFSVIFCIELLAYMNATTSGATVFSWFTNLGAVGQLLNYVSMCITTLRFRSGLKAQGIDISSLPFQGWRTVPYTWVSLIFVLLVVITQGWPVFTTGNWDVQTFLTDYFGIALGLVNFFGWKLWHKTKIVRVEDMDFVTGVKELDEYELKCAAEEKPPTNIFDRILNFLF